MDIIIIIIMATSSDFILPVHILLIARTCGEAMPTKPVTAAIIVGFVHCGTRLIHPKPGNFPSKTSALCRERKNGVAQEVRAEATKQEFTRDRNNAAVLGTTIKTLCRLLQGNAGRSDYAGPAQLQRNLTPRIKFALCEVQLNYLLK